MTAAMVCELMWWDGIKVGVSLTLGALGSITLIFIVGYVLGRRA